MSSISDATRPNHLSHFSAASFAITGTEDHHDLIRLMAADLLEQAALQRQPWLLLSGIENLQANNDDPYEDLLIRAEQMRVFGHDQEHIGWGQEAELHLIARLFHVNFIVRRHLQEEGGMRIVHTEFGRFLPFDLDEDINFVSSCFRTRLMRL